MKVQAIILSLRDMAVSKINIVPGLIELTVYWRGQEVGNVYLKNRGL